MFEHFGNLIAHAIEDAIEIDVDDFAPAFDAVGAGGVLLPADAGVVDRHIQAAEGFHGVGHHFLHRDRVGHVRVQVDGVAACLFDSRGGFLTQFIVHVHHRHFGAAARKGQRAGFADPRGAAGDQGDLVLELNDIQIF